MAAIWIDRIVRAAAYLRRHHRVAVPAGVLKVNVGSGIAVAGGWINLDGSLHALLANAPRSVLSFVYRRTHTVSRIISEDDYVATLEQHRFIFHNLEHGLPFERGVVDFIYCSHVLEHLALPDAEKLVAEMFRVLKPGGMVRLCVPDLARAVALYQQGAKREALEYFFTDGRSGSYDQHRYMYDFDLLAQTLQAAGFADITQCEYQQGAVPDAELLDNRPEQTLFVEALKPER